MDAKELHNNLSQSVDANATSEPENNQSASGVIPVTVKTSVAAPAETAPAIMPADAAESNHVEPEPAVPVQAELETAPAETAEVVQSEAAPAEPVSEEAPAVVPVRMTAHEEPAPMPGKAVMPAAVAEAVQAAEAEQATAPTPDLLQPADHLAHKSKAPAFAAVGALVVLGAAGGGAAYYFNTQANQPSVAVSTSNVSARSASSADAVAAGTITPSPTPDATPSPSPSPTPAPTAAPTPAPAAKVVTVFNGAGLNFHSTTVAVRSNIVGWLPNGSKITVDSSSGSWSHGTSGKVTGYFLTSYTK